MKVETTLTVPQKELATALLGVGAIKFGSFLMKLHETDPNAPLSPIYIDLGTVDNPKPGPLTPEIVTEIGKQLYIMAVMLEFTFDRVVGVPNAGDPLARALSKAPTLPIQEVYVLPRSGISIPLLKLEKQTTTEGRRIQGEIRGHFNPRDRVLLVDDLITAAHSKLEAIKMLEYQELVVHDVLVVLDREQGGAEQLAAKGYRLHAIFKLSKLLGWYLDQNMIGPDEYDKTMAYLNANR